MTACHRGNMLVSCDDRLRDKPGSILGVVRATSEGEGRACDWVSVVLKAGPLRQNPSLLMAPTHLVVAGVGACEGHIVVEAGSSQWASHLHPRGCRSRSARGCSSSYY
jgi:hypothetical protein